MHHTSRAAWQVIVCFRVPHISMMELLSAVFHISYTCENINSLKTANCSGNTLQRHNDPLEAISTRTT